MTKAQDMVASDVAVKCCKVMVCDWMQLCTVDPSMWTSPKYVLALQESYVQIIVINSLLIQSRHLHNISSEEIGTFHNVLYIWITY